jgi:hypothetical protein
VPLMAHPQPTICSPSGSSSGLHWSMHIRPVVFTILTAAIVLAIAVPASAQRYTFERSLDAGAGTLLDVLTERGKILVRDGEPGRVVIVGSATVRIGWNVPRDAVEIARRLAEKPPIEQDARTIRLRPPSTDAERRAVTIAYEVRVPKDTRVTAVSDSGAIDLAKLGATVDVTTGSGAVNAEAIGGDLRITTSSSAINARSLRGGFRAETGSGAVDVSLVGPGDVDVRTQSSSITLYGVRGSLTTSSGSGRTLVSGLPSEEWNVSTGSGAVDVTIEPAGSLTLDAVTRSGSVRAEGASVNGSITDRRVEGTIAGGGPLVRLSSRSGSIRVKTQR